jgi:hypothetical protein
MRRLGIVPFLIKFREEEITDDEKDGQAEDMAKSINVFDQVDLDAFKSHVSPLTDGGFVNFSDESEKGNVSEDEFVNMVDVSHDFKVKPVFGPDQTEIIKIIDPQFIFIHDFFTRTAPEKTSKLDYEYGCLINLLVLG